MADGFYVIDFGPVFFIVGLLISVLAAAMCVPAVVDLLIGHQDWQVFLGAAAVTAFIGVSLMVTNRAGRRRRLTLRQAFVLTALSWLSIAGFGSLPFAFSELDMSAADAFFESMSGVTTTGSTVIVGLDLAPPGILLWRALLQWLGGIGIVVMALAVLPMLSVGGMQLFQTEAFDQPEKVLPRAAQLAGGIITIYLFLTFTWMVALWFAGMGWFDALAHAMTTIATGGYSTKDGSIGHFESPVVEWIVIVGMIVGSLPFVHYLRMMQGNFGGISKDSQVRWFVTIVILMVGVITWWVLHEMEYAPMEGLRYAAFNVISVMTGTGYATTDFGAWGGFATSLLLILMFVGGCAGSTTCGIKIFRFQILHATAQVQLARLLRPHGVFIAYYNRKPIPDSVSEAVMGFFFLYMLCFAVLVIGLAAMDLDIITALSGAATAISNVGPGLGDVIGPTGSFDPLPDPAKWLLAFGMLLGRLELFTILVMLTPGFWRR